MTTTQELRQAAIARRAALVHPKACPCADCRDFFAPLPEDEPFEIDPSETVRDAYDYPHGGTAAGAYRHAEGPTEKQTRFIDRLAAQKGVDVPAPTTRKAASAAIDRLLALPDAARATAYAPESGVPGQDGTPPLTAGPAEGRFTKVADAWAVRITAGTATPGVECLVRKANGDTKTVTLGAPVQPGVYAVAPDAETLPDVRPCPEGIHQISDGTVYKVYVTQTSGRLAAKRLDVHGDHGEFEYEASAIRRHGLSAETLLDHDAAARFGQVYGFCVNCGRTLDDERSLNAGYGPTCAKRYGWPWGTKQQVSAS